MHTHINIHGPTAPGAFKLRQRGYSPSNANAVCVEFANELPNGGGHEITIFNLPEATAHALHLFAGLRNTEREKLIPLMQAMLLERENEK